MAELEFHRDDVVIFAGGIGRVILGGSGRIVVRLETDGLDRIIDAATLRAHQAGSLRETVRRSLLGDVAAGA